MTHKDFTNWLTGYLDGIGEDFLGKSEVSIIKKKLKSLEDDEMFHYSPQPIIPMPDVSKDDNPYKHIICDAAEEHKDDGTLKGTDLDNVYKDEIL